MIFQRIRRSIARKPYTLVIFQGGGADSLPPPPSGSAHAYTHSLARAFTACLLKVVDIQVRKLCTPSPKDVDCILASYIAYRSWNKTQFCSSVIHVHHKSVHTMKAQTSLRILRASRKFCQRGSAFDNVFFLS